jgi:hypothetical protein
MTASKAEASRTTLVTLDLGAALGVYLIGQKDAAGNVSGKLRLHLSDDLVQRFDVQAVPVVYDYDGIAVGNAVTVARFGGKCDAPR